MITNTFVRWAQFAVLACLLVSSGESATPAESFPSRIVLPSYPQGMRVLGRTASVKVILSVASSGIVNDVQIVAVPDDSKAAIETHLKDCLWQWKYPPDARPKKVALEVQYELAAADEEKSDYAVFNSPSRVEIVGHRAADG